MYIGPAWMQTYTGQKFNPLDPDPDTIKILDIAHALSMQCRYMGHCQQFYSVAEHCVHVASAAPEHLKLEALMHDAAEAYLSDIHPVIKHTLPGYRAMETRIMRTIADKYGFRWPEPIAVKALDLGILHEESEQNMGPPPDVWHLPEPPLGISLACWSPEDAEDEFLTAFCEYWNQRHNSEFRE